MADKLVLGSKMKIIDIASDEKKLNLIDPVDRDRLEHESEEGKESEESDDEDEDDSDDDSDDDDDDEDEKDDE
jgi:hypothetical protein